MGRRSDHNRIELKELALVATEEIVIKDGMAGVSARKIASQIGYTVGTLYLVFENLDDLIMQVNERTLTKMYDYIQSLLEGNHTPQESIRIVSQGYYVFAIENTHLWSLVYEYQFKTKKDLSLELTGRIAKLFSMIERKFAQMDNQNANPNTLRKSATTLWAAVHGITILDINRKLKTDLPAKGNELIDHLVDQFCA